MPIQNGKYVNPGWQNGGPPALDASELNAISDTLENLDANASVSGGQVSLSASGWMNNTQTVNALGVTPTNYVTVGPTPDTFSVAMQSSSYCSGQGNGTLTFTCANVPESTINYTYIAHEVI